MKITLSFIPPGGGEPDYSLAFDLPAISQPGDYISIERPVKSATEPPRFFDFIVKRTRWCLNYPNNDLYGYAGEDTRGEVTHIVVDCEFALSDFSCEEHKRSVEMYANRGRGNLRYE
jgi:hypothetical protein